MTEFDPNRDLKVEVTPEGAGYNLRSRGMEDYGRHDLVIQGVPESQVDNAGILINQAAAYIVETAVSSGERMGLELGGQMPIVTIFDAAPGTQRIADGHVEAGDTGIPKVALTTVALARATQAFSQQGGAAALSILEDAIEFYPGETVADAEPYFGYPYNWQNCLVYRELARYHSGQTGADYLRRACERSVVLQSQVLGAPFEVFEGIEADRVAERAAFIHRINVKSFHVEEGPNEGLAITISPLWQLGEEDAVHRSLAMVPAKLMELYWKQDVIEAVDSDEIYALVGEAVEAHSDDPAALASFVTDARRLWTDPSAPAKSFDIEYINGDVLFSSVVAHVARMLSGGADMPELRASLGLSDDPDALAALGKVEEKLRTIESDAYGAVMQRD